MLTGLCGGCLTGVPEYRQPPHSLISIRVVGYQMIENHFSEPRRVVGVRCGDIKSEAKESQRIPADRLGVASTKT
jgi:hypothetical protein